MRYPSATPARIKKSTTFWIVNIVALLATAQLSFAQHIIETVVGGGVGDGSVATNACVNAPCGVVTDSTGNIYIADTTHNRIRKIDAGTSIISTIAGNDIGTFAGDGGAATNASLNQPWGVVVDNAGNVFIADTNNNRIRKVNAGTGIISTVAGNGTLGYSGDGGAAISASLNTPGGLYLDSSGNIFIADTFNYRIRKVDAGTGNINTVAGNGASAYAGDGGAATSASLNTPVGVFVDSGGDIYIADTANNRIRKVSIGTGFISTVAGDGAGAYAGDGGAATSASLYHPHGVYLDSGGNILIADTENHRIRKVATGTEVISTIAGTGTGTYAGDGGVATSASINYPNGVSVDSTGNIYISDRDNHRIRKIDLGTNISTIAGNGTTTYAGDGGAAINASLKDPSCVYVDGGGNIYIADYGNHRIRKVDAGTGNILTVAGNGTGTYAGDGGAATSASINNSYGVYVDGGGNIYIADYGNHRIRKVDAGTGIISTVAGNGTGTYAGDGGAAISASLYYPCGVYVDSGGNIFIADKSNHRIRKVVAGNISTVAGNGTATYAGDGGAATDASLNFPFGECVDGVGNIFIAEKSNHRIRKVDAGTGNIDTVAGNGTATYAGDGGAATSASLNEPYGVYMDSGGNIFIADRVNCRIRKVDAGTGIITTVAGDGSGTYAGDGGVATSASLYSPQGIFIDSSGNIFIADTANNRIRKVANNLPVADEQTPSTTEENDVGITLTGSDSDGDPLTYTLVTVPANGTLSGATPDLTYTPNPDFYGTDVFTYKAYDTYAFGAVATVTITISAVNDEPSFAVGLDPTVDEDAAAQSVIGWATALSSGPANEATQTLTFNVSNDNNALFSAQPAISATGVLTFTPEADANGSAIVTVALQDDGGTDDGGVDTTADQYFTIYVNAVNDAPSFTKGADEVILEDAGDQSVPGWATAIFSGPSDESGQTLIFSATTTNDALFATLPDINSSGDLTYKPADDAVGSATVSVILSDDGGTASGGVDSSTPQLFVITVNPVNDAPSFTKGADQTVNEDAATQSVIGWATALSKGPTNESGQTLTFIVSNTNNALFSAQPAIDAAGKLTYTPAANANGSAIVSATLTDNGGIANGGVDSSAQETFTITVNSANDAPSFTKGADQTVNEDAAAQNVAGWATAISNGPADESGQTLTFTVSNTNNALFSAQPAIDAAGTLTYTPLANANGSAIVSATLTDNGGTANGGVDSSTPQTFTITVNAVNDAPSFAKGADQTVFEDAGAQNVPTWATSIAKGPADESSQTLIFSATTSNDALFSALPVISATGVLTYTPAANAVGSASVSVILSDDGGTANGGVNSSTPQIFSITVNPVNDAPSFTKGADQTVNEDAAAQNVAGWATAISKGSADESGQTLTFIVSNTNNALFSAQPAIDAAGTLTYTPLANANGSAIVSATLTDNGGTANGGVDSSTPQTFTITVNAVNDAPSFAKGADQTVFEDAGAQNVPTWATSIAKGPADESSQTLIFSATTTNDALFSALPVISATGVLTYTPAANAVGSASVSVILSDDGGTANGGVNSSTPQIFSITVNPVNDAPSFTKGADQTVNEDAAAQNVAGWATAISKGSADESGQTLTFIVSNTNNALFSAQPAIDAAGTLTYTPAANAFGSAIVSATLTDNGGTANGGVDSSTQQTFTITVNSANDAPSFAKGADQTVNEDAAAQSVIGWATDISKGPADESGQALIFGATTSNDALFSALPVISATGVLTYTPAPDAFGSAIVSVTLSDNGGTANGGVDSSTPQTFTITLNPVNDVPSFIKGANQTVVENTPAQSVIGWATAISKGPANESGQTLTFTAINTNNALFSSQPAIGATGTLTYTPAASAIGIATVSVTLMDDGGTANGGVNTSATQTFTINVTSVNDAPSFIKGANQTVNEDAAAQTVIGWATAISAGPADESWQALIFSATTTNDALFSSLPAIDSTGVLTYTPAADVSGSATVSVTLMDDGGTASGGVDSSTPQTFTITVNPVNDAPSFTKGADPTVNEDAGAQSESGWATGISKGPIDEASQTLIFIVYNTNPALFSTQPAISASGTLSYTPAVNAFGSAIVSATLSDNGGTANGGVDSSTPQTFTITINSVNDQPGFTKGADQTVNEDAAAQSVIAWATALSAGPANEASQTFTFIVANTNNSLFSAQPVVSATGTLSYTPAANANGSATATVTLQDNGGTANGGVNSSTPQTFTITINAVNDAPIANATSYTTPANTPVTITLTGSDVENSPLTYAVAANPGHGLLSGTAPNLTYTPTTNYLGLDSFVFKVNDGALDSATATIAINVSNSMPIAVDDAAETWLNHAVAVDVLDNDSDPDNDAIHITAVTQGAHGSVIHDGSKATYTPNTGFTGTDTFTYTINDVNSLPDTASVSVTVYERVTADAGSDVSGELGKAIALRAEATGGDGSYAFSWGIVSGSSTQMSQFSSATVQNPTFTPSFAGSYILQCTAADAIAPPATDTLRVTVTHRPVVQNRSVNADENTSVEITLTGADADNDSLTFQIQSNPGNGTLSNFNAQTGTLTYTPPLHFWGVDTFTYAASDGILTSAPKTVTVTTANTINDPPVAYPVTAETNENTAVSIQMTSSDPDGYGARLYQIVTNPAHGGLSNLDAYAGTVLYTPSVNYYGSDSFAYRAVDVDNGGVSDPAGVSIAVKYVEGLEITTPTPTPTGVPTNTPIPTSTPWPTNTAVSTPTHIPTNTAVSTITPKPTNTIVNTPTPTRTAANTPIPTPTNTAVNTPTDTPTTTPTGTAVNTPIPTPTNGEANTPTPTSTEVNTPTPTPTITPTPVPPTPTPIVVIVTDNPAAMVDLSNATDWDYMNSRNLTLQWDLTLAGVEPADIMDIHIYVEVDGSGQFNYLGRMDTGTATGFDWKAKAPLTHRDYRQGPEYGHAYRFRLFALTQSGDPLFYGPFDTAGPVQFLPAVTVTDDVASEEDLSNGVDRDAAANRSLTIRWMFDADLVTAENVKEFHVYVRVNDQAYKYLGTTQNADSTYLEWKTTKSKAFSAPFRTGPQFGALYQFKVYALTKNRPPLFYGPFAMFGPVQYQQGD